MWPSTAAVDPARSMSQSSTESAPPNTAWITVIALRPTFARGVAEIDMLGEQFSQAEMLRQRGRQDQPGVTDQTVIIEVHCQAVKGVRDRTHREGVLDFWEDSGFAITILPGQDTFSADGPTPKHLIFGGSELRGKSAAAGEEVLGRGLRVGTHLRRVEAHGDAA